MIGKRRTLVGSTVMAMVLVGCAPSPVDIDPRSEAQATEAPISSSPSPATVECPPTPLDVVLDYELQQESAGVVVVVRSNLPDTAELMVSLFAPDRSYLAQDNAALDQGQARFGPYSDDGVPLTGSYELSIRVCPISCVNGHRLRCSVDA